MWTTRNYAYKNKSELSQFSSSPHWWLFLLDVYASIYPSIWMSINVLIINLNGFDCYTFKNIRHAGCCAVMQHVMKFYIAFCILIKTKNTARFRNTQWKLQRDSVTFVKCDVYWKTEAARVVTVNSNWAPPSWTTAKLSECQHAPEEHYLLCREALASYK